MDVSSKLSTAGVRVGRLSSERVAHFVERSVLPLGSFLTYFVGEVNELVREKDLLSLERKCEHHATETAINNAREMQKQAAKSAKDAGKNKGMNKFVWCQL